MCIIYMNNKLLLKTHLEKEIYNIAFKGASDVVVDIKKLRLSKSSKSRNQVFGRLRHGAIKNTLKYKKHRKVRNKMIEFAIKDVFNISKLEERLTYGGKKNRTKNRKKRRTKNRTKKRGFFPQFKKLISLQFF